MRHALAALTIAALTILADAAPAAAQVMAPRAFLPYARADQPPTPTPIPTITPGPVMPNRTGWRWRTADEVVDRFQRDGLHVEVYKRESIDRDGIRVDSVSIYSSYGGLVVSDCYDSYSLDMLLLGWALLAEDGEDIDAGYLRNIVMAWSPADAEPFRYVASLLAECDRDPLCGAAGAVLAPLAAP